MSLTQGNQMQQRSNNYRPGHPWFYVLGGSVLGPKQILKNVKASSYKGCKADSIEKMGGMPDPKRSQELRAFRKTVLAELVGNLSRYREVVCALHQHRREVGGQQPAFDEVHGNVSLKHNHLYNDFAHLVTIDELLAEQPDLFGF